MAASSPQKVTLSARQRKILERLVRDGKTPQRLALRCRIVLMSADGLNNREQARKLGVDHQRTRRWRKRFAEHKATLTKAERKKISDKDLKDLLISILSDNERPGTPGKFTVEQWAKLIELSCQQPEEHGLPISHWTPADLARKAQELEIVDSISPRHVDRFLKGDRPAAAQE